MLDLDALPLVEPEVKITEERDWELKHFIPGEAFGISKLQKAMKSKSKQRHQWRRRNFK
jgi:hypothetical protein